MIISADSHIVEPPDLYQLRFPKSLRHRAPHVKRHYTSEGKAFDAWHVDGIKVGTSLGNFVQAGRRFGDDKAAIDFLGVWEDVMPGAYQPDAMIKDLEVDGVWGAVVQTGQGVFWYRLEDSTLLSAICAAYNDWIAEFCSASPGRLRGIACLNVDDVEAACEELQKCAKAGLAGAFIPVVPRAGYPYSHPVYERLWATAEAVGVPLMMHITTPRANVPGCELSSLDVYDWSAAARVNADYWVRYSLTAIIFAGVFDRYPALRVGSVEHEAAWVPFWLKQMDWLYNDRPNVFAKGWRSKFGFLPSDYFRRNSFVVFVEDSTAVRLRDLIGVDNMMWGNDYPHAEASWPRSNQFLDAMFSGVSLDERRRITCDNAIRMFNFQPPPAVA